MISDEAVREEAVGEQIGDTRLQFSTIMRSQNWGVVDIHRSDYAFWDSLRRGKAKGAEIIASLVKAIGSKKASWVLGKPPVWETSNDAVTDDLNRWWRKNHADILRAYHEAVDLGDCYLVLNADLSLTVLPPEMVSPIVDEANYATIVGWRVQMLVPHPREKQWYGERKYQVHIYEYHPTYTDHIIRTPNDETVQRVRYHNPTGRIPIIHIPNRRGADERYGRPECEPFLPLFYRYTDVLDTALKGNIRQGRPTPTINHMGDMRDVEAFWKMFGSESKRLNPATGQLETVYEIRFDPDVLLTLGGEAVFKYESPGSFSSDTETLLGILFMILVEGSEIPEFVWGTAIGSSKASAESQLEPFVKWILKQRGEAMTWINQLTELVLAFMSVTRRRARTVTYSSEWRPIAAADGRLVLDSAIYAYSQHKIDDETLLYLLPLGIDDPRTTLDKAAKQDWDDTDAGTDSSGSTFGDEPYENPSQPSEHR